MIPEAEAVGTLREQYDRARTPRRTVDNVMSVHSLRPHTMDGHVALYRSVLHHADNTLPLWFAEVLAAWTSILNDYDYSLAHHFSNARRLIGDDPRADEILAARKAHEPDTVFEGKERAPLAYAEKLTTNVARMEAGDIENLREAGVEDKEILEANQVVACFKYSNRILNGPGVTTESDSIGYYD